MTVYIKQLDFKTESSTIGEDMSNKDIPFKSKSKKKSLKDKLNKIYNTVDLSTTCEGKCECCKVACPSMNYSEFIELVKEVWNNESRGSKIDLICTSIEYFFKNEFEKFEMETLIKPCMLLSEEDKCKYYENRPLSCRLYGLWPEDVYKNRVDKFEKAYEGLLERDKIPLSTQCPYVKRVNEEKELTSEVIDGMFEAIDELDKKTGNYSAAQVSQKENYRTFHDWLLLKVFGEEWLSNLTTLMIAADKEVLVEQFEAIQAAMRNELAKNMPDITS